MNSGPEGAFKTGSWDGLELPVIGWRVWFANGEQAQSGQRMWSELPDGVLMVVVYHDRGRRTRMISCDAYPPPPGCEGRALLGEQVGEVNCQEWFKIRERINQEAAQGLVDSQAGPRSRSR